MINVNDESECEYSVSVLDRWYFPCWDRENSVLNVSDKITSPLTVSSEYERISSIKMYKRNFNRIK